jgi:hypothetical protein
MAEPVIIGPCTLYLGDCESVLPTLAAVDCVVTDPPYGIAACNRSDGGVGSIASGSKFYGRESWDLKPADPALIESLVGMNVPTCIWGGNYFKLPPSSCWFIWDKQQRGFTFADAEMAWTNQPKAVRCFNYSRGELVQEGKCHPTQKPLPLIVWCIEQLRIKDNSVVLDPFMGSGTTAVACIRTDRKFIGIEKEERYFNIACRRIEREWMAFKSRLPFDPPPQLTQAELFTGDTPCN